MTYESKKNWILAYKPSGQILAKYGLDPLLASLLYQREIHPHEAKDFLNPSIDQIPDCTHLYGSDEVANTILKSAANGEKIYIHGDFDADGICATSILWDFMYRQISKKLSKKVDVMPFIPDRASEGYGLSESSIQKLIQEDVKMLITVDCGVRDKELIQKYQKKNKIKFVITDHHQPPEDILKGLDYSLLHPMYPGNEYPEKEISGAFVALLLVQAMRRELEMDWDWNSLLSSYDLAALSTVTDMMPLKGVNRSITSVGIRQIQDGDRLGMNSLIELAGLDKKDVDSYHLGFVIGPRINAAGRIGSAMDGVRLLTSKSELKAKQMAVKLDQLNKQRQQLTEDLMKKSLDQIEADQKILIIIGEEWPEGIIGLIAGKIMERYRKPTVVMTRNKAETRGSARSLDDFNITDALSEVSEFLDKFGGHAEAAGFSIKEGKIDHFIEALREVADREIDEKKDYGDYKIDLVLNLEDVSVLAIDQISRLAPFGMGNRKPIFMVERAIVMEKKEMGADKNHMSLNLKSGVGEIKGVLFNCQEDIEKISNDDILDIAGYLDLNTWQGRTSVQFMIKQWKFAD